LSQTAIQAEHTLQRHRVNAMGWLRFDTTAEESFEVERACRVIRSTTDTDELRRIAEQCYRAWAMQTRLATQLLQQMAELEAKEIRQQPPQRRRGPLAWFGVG
jgi:hypothetical protein